MPLSLDLSYLYMDWFCHDGKPSRYAALLHCLGVWTGDRIDDRLFPKVQAEHLLDMAESDDRIVRANALCGMVLLAIRHGDRLPRFFTDRLIRWAENDTLTNEILLVQKHLLAAITGRKQRKKLREEVIDKMHREQQALRDRLGLTDDEDERMEIAEQGSKLLESYATQLDTMVKDGVDINFDTFAALAGQDIFHELKNWLLDFDIDHPALQNLGEKKMVAGALFGHAELCDLDKYALTTTVGRMPMPDKMNIPMPESFAQRLATPEARAAMQAERSTNAYRYAVQTLIRFFLLSPWRKEVANPFAMGPFLTDYNVLAPMLTDHFLLGSAKLFIGNGFYSHPAAHLRSWMHRNGQTDEALRLLALCDKHLGENRERLHCLLELEKRNPDDMHLVRETGLSLIQDKQYDEALKRFFHLEVKEQYLHGSARAIAWCSLLTGNLSRAARYYKKLLSWEGGPTWEDLLNAGHCTWLGGNPIEASGLYSRYLAVHDDDLEAFDRDRDILLSLGLNADDISLMRDTIAM